MALFKRKQISQPRASRTDLSLDEIIEHLSEQERHWQKPFLDDVQSLLVHLDSTFRVCNGTESEPNGTNSDRALYLCLALLLKKLQDNH